ncbi:MAG TPA: PrsW family glutamic-type intramembrane protease [Candidatus Portnoybacteria bacterium]|jgi:protease PrsW|nr:PrsW family glutamic-type intramembrane protease [Candidatus Portnoybacteria bacterium]MDD5751918.1 PrsW family glutamic-type intramembrane protease [Candidatus Portnoybacteria bacterium]HNU96959.1 PrsW family glutamic-type intramembrane protease [Candidatus Portnoybacteria bacterium]HOZ16278.1 PrsW family glutamic-type intramembrane protease [Candidatus Portnoybacteria bacterium]HPH51926.1 PrsW family glutamic-type intramembrane protease [Candidatus Portnoybacteria bacterium]
MKLLLCILLAPLPSIIWLAFYLRKDKHPEPNKLVVKIFLLGAIAIAFAALLEQGIYVLFKKISLMQELIVLVVSFAFIEEWLKYIVVKFGILKNPNFDEPVDSMIYMIISALGFAAAENIYLLSQISPLKIPISETIEFITMRFVGATFLHALASAILGYFLAISLCKASKFRKTLIFNGLAIATILHSIFNYIIILNINGQIETYHRNGLVFVLLITNAIIVSIMFKKINKLKPVCKI